MIDKIYNTKKYCKRKKLKNEKKITKDKDKTKKKQFTFIQYCNSKIAIFNYASWHMICNLDIVEQKKEAIL